MSLDRLYSKRHAKRDCKDKHKIREYIIFAAQFMTKNNKTASLSQCLPTMTHKSYPDRLTNWHNVCHNSVQTFVQFSTYYKAIQHELQRGSC